MYFTFGKMRLFKQIL